MGYKRKALIVAGLVMGVSSLAVAGSGGGKPKLMTGASTTMLANTCAGCHGTNGISAGPGPTIAGISSEYFNEIMKGFKSGDVPSTIMGRIAKGYSDAEIEALGKHFSSQKFVAAKQDFDPAKAKKGAKLHDKYCEKCHGEGGTSSEDDAGILSGQHVQYLRWALDDAMAGDRVMPKKMRKKLKKLHKKEGDAGIEALLNFYASKK
jgi:sulfide dehydrogenase cytochrome subunit